ncbi:ABC transporter substrate-binding protein [Pirellulaceae bacterium SH449]
MKIVSLIPAATEIVALLGFEDSLIGISHECDFPSSVAQIEQLTFSRIPAGVDSAQIDALTVENAGTADGLFGIKSDRLLELAPDFIITQTICDVCAVSSNALSGVMKVLSPSTRLIALSPTSLADVLNSLKQVAAMLESPERGMNAYKELCERLDLLMAKKRNVAPKTAVLLEWLDPLFSAGHWNPEIVEYAGGQELIGRKGEKSQRIDWNDLRKADPEHLIVACCGYNKTKTQNDFDRFLKANPAIELAAVRSGNVHIMDGNAYFNRPGPRLIEAAEILCDRLSGPRGAIAKSGAHDSANRFDVP